MSGSTNQVTCFQRDEYYHYWKGFEKCCTDIKEIGKKLKRDSNNIAERIKNLKEIRENWRVESWDW